ncbi:hypothetical protein [Paracidovorax oryzae]|uniref:hypothetical protein n=1 Tax=Paracidovorax oryzae TaxID=862720 RepID=UPI0012EB0FC6|nr:hypothetical protein [Paracidovorax oryzae]
MEIFNKENRRCTGIIAAAFLFLFLTLFLRPYDGVRHDSILYFGQSIRILIPSELDRDLFFAHGSQSQYTIFPQMLAKLLENFQPGAVSMAGLLLAFGLFLLANALFSNIAVPKRLVVFSIACVLIWPSGYGGFGVFRFQEPYLTGRSFSEPLVILALALLLSKKPWLALMMLACAALIHPLQVLPGMIVWWAWQASENRKWFLLPLLAALALLILSALNIPPANNLFIRYDQEWLDAISEPNKHVYMLEWPLQSWLWLIIDCFILLAAMPWLNGKAKRYVKVLLYVSLACFAVSILFVDICQFVWAAGVQLWRIHWILHWSAMIFAPTVVYGLYTRRLHAKLVLFAAVMLAAAPYGAFASVYAAIFLMPLYFFWDNIKGSIGLNYVRLLYAGITVALFGTYLRYLWYLLKVSDYGWSGAQWANLLLGVSHPIVLTPIVLLGIWCWRNYERVRVYLLCGLAVGFVLSAAYWDRRTERMRLIESSPPTDSVFGYPIEAGASVFWYGDLLSPWMLLKRSSYWSDLQQAGLLFNRGTAIEAQRRALLLEPFLFQAEFCQLMDRLNNKHDSCQIDIDSLKGPCHDSHASLNYLVLPQRLSVAPLGKIFLSDGPEKFGKQIEYGRHYYLYSCKDI